MSRFRAPHYHHRTGMTRRSSLEAPVPTCGSFQVCPTPAHHQRRSDYRQRRLVHALLDRGHGPIPDSQNVFFTTVRQLRQDFLDRKWEPSLRTLRRVQIETVDDLLFEFPVLLVCRVAAARAVSKRVAKSTGEANVRESRRSPAGGG